MATIRDNIAAFHAAMDYLANHTTTHTGDTPMRLGTDTASLVNALYAAGARGQPDPYVGMGATLLHWTDRSAGTITEVKPWQDGWHITVRQDVAKLTSGTIRSEDQTYDYQPGMKMPSHQFRCRADGRWFEVQQNPKTGRWRRAGGMGLTIGRRDHYRDPSF